MPTPNASVTFDADRMYCGAIKRGDIFICALASGDQPVVVLQDDILNERLSTVMVAPIESAKKGERVFRNEALFNRQDTGLPAAGICRLYRLQTVRREQMIIKKGELSHSALPAVYAALDINLGRFRDL